MKATDSFTKTISDHLQQVAATDPLFAKSLEKPNKNIKECITYILNTVQKSGCNGFEDSEIFGMAIHYYDEDDIQPGKEVKAKVVVNHHVAKESKPSKDVQPKSKKPSLKATPVPNQISMF